MGRKLSGVAAAVLIGVTVVPVSALAQGTGEDGARPTVGSAGTGSSAGVGPGERVGEGGDDRGGVGAPGPVEPRPGAVVAPSLGDPNRGMSGYYRNRTGMTPPSGRGGGWSNGGRSSGGRSSGGRW